MVGISFLIVVISLLIRLIFLVLVGLNWVFCVSMFMNVFWMLNICIVWVILLLFGSRFSVIFGRLSWLFLMLVVIW